MKTSLFEYCFIALKFNINHVVINSLSVVCELIQTCSNPDCLYLHDIGSQEDSFTKDEIISAYTRYFYYIIFV